MNYLDFLENKKQKAINNKIISEAFKNSDLQKAQKLIFDLFKKNINYPILSSSYQLSIKSDSENFKSIYYIAVNGEDIEMAWVFNYLNSGESTAVYSIDFYEEEEFNKLLTYEKCKPSLTIKTMGASIVYFMPIIYHIVNTHNYSLTQEDAKRYAKQVFKESLAIQYPFYIGNYKYNIIEGLSENIVRTTFDLNINEAIKVEDENLNNYKKDLRRRAVEANKTRYESPEAEAYSKKLWKDYNNLLDIIKGGARTLEEVKIVISGGKTTQAIMNSETIEAEKEFELEHQDPDEVFKEMKTYVNMVIRGIQSSTIICGAPGVGKTYKINQQLKAAGYKQDVNLKKIKGKCTAKSLYIALYNFKRKGDILLIDDADVLVGPHAPEDSIDLLKAALDTTADDEGRLVSWGTSAKILDPETGMELPHSFHYNGGVIIITNYNAGQLDTALRGRSYIHDIHFTVEDNLLIIKRLIPVLETQTLSMKSKLKAYDYLKKLSEAKSNEMVISIRTFILCASLYESNDTAAEEDKFQEEQLNKMMIKQMKLQALRGGKKY